MAEESSGHAHHGVGVADEEQVAASLVGELARGFARAFGGFVARFREARNDEGLMGGINAGKARDQFVERFQDGSLREPFCVEPFAETRLDADGEVERIGDVVRRLDGA